MGLSISSSYPTKSATKNIYNKTTKLINAHYDKQSRNSFMSNGTLDQFKFEQMSRHSSIISNKSGGSKSSKFYRLKKEGRMNLIE